MKDVADVYIGAENENSTLRVTALLTLYGDCASSDANPLEVADLVHKEVEAIQKFLPDGTRLAVDYDSTVFIDRSISVVYSTLFITGGLVILVLTSYWSHVQHLFQRYCTCISDLVVYCGVLLWLLLTHLPDGTYPVDWFGGR